MVHCANGSNRSSTVVISILMMLTNVSLKNAWITVKTHHPKSMPLKDNRAELMVLDKKRNLQDASMTEEDFFKPVLNLIKLAQRKLH